MRTRIPHWKRALAVLLSMSLVLASVPAQAGKITRYVHTDHLGSVSAKTDSTGVVMMRRSFTPYGENEQAETDGPGYTGHYSDTGSGLVYMQARYYDPEIGRFLSVDPVTFSTDKPQQFNRYWYANGNPYFYNDPDGKYPTFFGAISSPGMFAVVDANSKAVIATTIPPDVASDINYRARQATLNTVAGITAILSLTPAAPVAAPISAVASTAAFIDTMIVEGADATDVIVYLATTVPTARLIRTAKNNLTELIRKVQASLGAMAAANGVVNAVEEVEEGSGGGLRMSIDAPWEKEWSEARKIDKWQCVPICR